MPSFVINTNVARDKIPANFVLDLSSVIAELTGKPESYVAIQVNADQLMSFGGTTEPCAVCTLGNVGRLSNKDISKVVMEKINESLKIPSDRVYIFFSTLAGGDVGFNKKTF